MRRHLHALGATALATAMAMLAGGCGGGAADTEVTLTVLAADYGDRTTSPSSAYWEDLTDRFTEDNPSITVEVEMVPWERLDDTLAQRVADGAVPDLAQANTFADYAAEGLLYPAEDLVSTPTRSDFLAPLVSAGEVRYQQYGLPFASSTMRLFYNQELFDRAGVAGPPETWEELRGAAEALRGAGVAVPYSLQFAPGAVQEEALTWLLAGGGGYTDAVGGYALDSDANAETLAWLKENLIDEGLAGPDPSAQGRAQAYGGFLSGQVGMLLAHPNLMGAATQAGVSFGHADLPSRDGGFTSPAGISDWLLAFRDGGRGEEAGTFLDFLYRADNWAAAASRFGVVPTTYTASDRLLEDEEHRRLWPFVDQMPGATLLPLNKGSWPQVRDHLDGALAAAVAEGGDPAAELAAVQSTATAAER